jgi:DNA-binding CsgD family transcriptional regulator
MESDRSMNITPREKTIVFWLSKEFTAKQIAEKISLKEITVKKDLTKLYRHYEVKGRVGLLLKYNVSLDGSPAEI